jgi:hypothetical protein
VAISVGGSTALLVDSTGTQGDFFYAHASNTTASATGFGFQGDQNTGVFRAGANQLGFSANGQQLLTVRANMPTAHAAGTGMTLNGVSEFEQSTQILQVRNSTAITVAGGIREIITLNIATTGAQIRGILEVDWTVSGNSNELVSKTTCGFYQSGGVLTITDSTLTATSTTPTVPFTTMFVDSFANKTQTWRSSGGVHTGSFFASSATSLKLSFTTATNEVPAGELQVAIKITGRY